MEPVAQNLQLRLQPICDETQAVNLDSVGIKTPSTKCPSQVLKRVLTVPSALCCVVSIASAGKIKFSPNCWRSCLLRLVMSAKLRAPFCQIHSYACLARNFFSPTFSKYSSSSSKVKCRIFFCAVLGMRQRYHGFKDFIDFTDI